MHGFLGEMQKKQKIAEFTPVHLLSAVQFLTDPRMASAEQARCIESSNLLPLLTKKMVTGIR
jgi:hypothetical protein